MHCGMSTTVYLVTICGEWMDKDAAYIHTMEYYSAIKKSEILTFATIWMDLEDIMLSEVSQIKKRQIPCDLTYM